MPVELADPIDELLPLAGIPPDNSAARRWLETALDAARSIGPVPQPSPAERNAPLGEIEKAVAKLVAAFEQLKSHSYTHASFWRFAAFVHGDRFERRDVMHTLKNIGDAARKAREGRAGRPRKLRKQHIVNWALAFCARFSPARPSSDVNNFFPPFAERFFQLSTGLSVESQGNGVDRQIRVALNRLPIEMERAALLNETHPNNVEIRFSHGFALPAWLHCVISGVQPCRKTNPTTFK